MFTCQTCGNVSYAFMKIWIQISDLLFFCTVTRGYYIDYNALRKQKKKNGTTNYINENHERWNVPVIKGVVRLSSWSLPSAINWRKHLHKTTTIYNGERKIKGAKSRTLIRFYIKTIEMIIGCGQRNQLVIKKVKWSQINWGAKILMKHFIFVPF